MIVTKHKPQALWSNVLYGYQKELEVQYRQYCSGKISEQEYLDRIKPIDRAIGELEMATLRDNPA
jgi:CTP:phosphocholine cytidylyltransferase-like protein